MKVRNDVQVAFRVDRDMKERAEALFDRLGMNMSTALNIFLRKALDEEAIPFSVSTRKTVFGNGYTPDDVTSAFVTAVQNEVADNQRNGHPIARYDAESKRAYLEASDATREYVNE